MATILTNQKLPYLHNSLADRHKILHDDAQWFSEPYLQFKNRLVKNTRRWTAAILKEKR